MREAVPSLPGVERLSIDNAVDYARQARDANAPALAIFPYTGPEDRSANGDLALDPDNLMCRAARAIKEAVPDIGLIADVALDPYTDHGHDGILTETDRGFEIDNDASVEVLVQQAVIQAKAGYDVVAPSDMMDGRVAAVRDGLERENLVSTQIVSYAAKYASGLYGPYRDAIGASGVLKGDKKTYQMNPANTDEAIREIALDISEGADGIMVKPAGFYLDIIRRAKSELKAPTYAFQVSGECAMIEAGAQNGWIDRETVMTESLLAIKRAGADAIISYFAPAVSKLIR